MLTPGQIVELSVEKAAAGGRMLARHDGQVVLVAGAVPGERVSARIERVERRLAFAAVVDVVEPSSDRRAAFPDPACAGCVYSHISYPRQLELKADILRDAFSRLGRIPLDQRLDIMASPERGYRTRARFHVVGGDLGFFRQGTHSLCDAGPTGQIADRTLEAVKSFVVAVTNAGGAVTSVELAENIEGDELGLSLSLVDVRAIAADVLTGAVRANDVKGCIAWDDRGRSFEAGDRRIVDRLPTLTSGRASAGELRHRPEAFFQGNRFLVPALVTSVLDAVTADGPILDLYAGVGLFAFALAASGRQQITAVEGDPVSGVDLEDNASRSAFSGAVTVERSSVEKYVERRLRSRMSPATIIVDPPRTGMTSDALQSIVKLAPARIVYVSCDPATMARDARRLVDGRYRLDSLRGFDLFPNTPHIESLGVFAR